MSEADSPNAGPKGPVAVPQPERTRPDAKQRLEPRYLDLDGLLDDLEREVVCRTSGFFSGPALAEQPIEADKRRLGLAISGGGASGAYSAGSIDALVKALDDRGIPVDIIVGTSSGALNGYGLFLEKLGKHNRALFEDPEMRQPYGTFIASMWSYLDRNHGMSDWVVGRRAWMVDFASKGIDTPLKRWGLTLLAVLALFLFNPLLFVSLFLFAGWKSLLPSFIADWDGLSHDPAWQLAVLGFISTAGLAAMVLFFVRAYRGGLFRDTPLLRLLANTGPDGDLSQPWRWPHDVTKDRARVLSREVVEEWYRRRDEAPELIITATNITLGRECLFTLVRPETYRKLVESGWLAVQIDSPSDDAKEYREVDGALFTLPQNLLQCIVASASVPSAFPTQEIRLYEAQGRREVTHRFVDGGVLNNSPLHLAIDAGATHIVSLELDPLKAEKPLEADEGDEGYNLLEAGVTTFTTLLRLAIERDIRRTVTWNRFLTSHPSTLAYPRGVLRPGPTPPEERKRIIHLFRIAPEEMEVDTAEFDGHFHGGRRTATVRDLVRRGVVDLKGKNIWRATLQSTPGPRGERIK